MGYSVNLVPAAAAANGGRRWLGASSSTRALLVLNTTSRKIHLFVGLVVLVYQLMVCGAPEEQAMPAYFEKFAC